VQLQHSKLIWSHRKEDGEDVHSGSEMDESDVDGYVEDWDDEKDNEHGHAEDPGNPQMFLRCRWCVNAGEYISSVTIIPTF
jgi:hypothetical protein